MKHNFFYALVQSTYDIWVTHVVCIQQRLQEVRGRRWQLWSEVREEEEEVWRKDVYEAKVSGTTTYSTTTTLVLLLLHYYHILMLITCIYLWCSVPSNQSDQSRVDSMHVSTSGRAVDTAAAGVNLRNRRIGGRRKILAKRTSIKQYPTYASFSWSSVVMNKETSSMPRAN